MSLCVYICKCRSSWKTKENFRSPGTGGADSYELSSIGVEYQILVLKKGRKHSLLLNYLSSLNHIYLLSMFLHYIRHYHTSIHWTYFSPDTYFSFYHVLFASLESSISTSQSHVCAYSYAHIYVSLYIDICMTLYLHIYVLFTGFYVSERNKHIHNLLS